MFKFSRDYFIKLYDLPFTIWCIIILIILLLLVFILYIYNKQDQDTLKTKQRNHLNPEMTYYVCSYGGCGSYMLCAYLKKFGNVEHIHSRKPPKNLEYIGTKNTNNPTYFEWFNGVEIPDKDLKNYKVIYLYKDPVKAIYSRFESSDHLQHVQCDPTIKFNQVANSEKDLYGLEEFFDNYTTKEESRNYPIYCVKYEDFWNNLPEFNAKLGIPDNPNLYPVRKETNREQIHNQILYKIYNPLLKKMSKMSFIEIV